MVAIASEIGGARYRELHVYRVRDGRIIERWGLRVADGETGS